jgi:dTDP-4-dehydrorhamnose reductase
MNNLLILGSNGLLGSSVSPIVSSASDSVFLHSRLGDDGISGDLNSLNDVNKILSMSHPNIILNFAALADVDSCENTNAAYLSNVKVLENIVNSIRENAPNCFLINISTDHVYDGSGYSKEEDVFLSNYYSFSKYTGELVVSQIDGCSIRTNFFGKSKVSNKYSFTDWLMKTLSDGDTVKVFKDVYFNPLSMTTLAKNIGKIASVSPSGVFNLGSRNGLSKAEFANIFAEEMCLPTANIETVKIDEVDFIKTRRPKDMRMNVEKIERVLGVDMPLLIDEIKLVAKEYRDEL